MGPAPPTQVLVGADSAARVHEVRVRADDAGGEDVGLPVGIEVAEMQGQEGVAGVRHVLPLFRERSRDVLPLERAVGPGRDAERIGAAVAVEVDAAAFGQHGRPGQEVAAGPHHEGWRRVRVGEQRRGLAARAVVHTPRAAWHLRPDHAGHRRRDTERRECDAQPPGGRRGQAGMCRPGVSPHARGGYAGTCRSGNNFLPPGCSGRCPAITHLGRTAIRQPRRWRPGGRSRRGRIRTRPGRRACGPLRPAAAASRRPACATSVALVPARACPGDRR